MSILRLLACLTVFFAMAVGRAAAADEAFSWRQCSGQHIRVMLSKHPYSEGIKRKLADFEALTGIKVAYIMYPEARYFQNLEDAFESPAGDPDVYMTGVYQVWEYALKRRMEPLDAYIVNQSLTRQSYNLNDFYPNVSGAFRWNGKAGAKLGVGTLWAIPLGFEASALTYNREVLARMRLSVPDSMEELLETGKALNKFEGEGTYGVAARGAGQWNSLHSGYITACWVSP